MPSTGDLGRIQPRDTAERVKIMKTSNLLPVIAGILCMLAAAPHGRTEEPVDEYPDYTGGRGEIWLATSSWPALVDLRPAADGAFDDVGFALGGGMYWPVKHFENSELLWGVEATLGATESNIAGRFDSLLARHLYAGTGLKWRFSDSRKWLLSTGLGFHLVDIADLDSDYLGALEYEYWEESAIGGYVGLTRDFGARTTLKQSGWFFATKVHFVDLGVVRDEDEWLTPLIGPNAGQLDGPVFFLEFGYGGR